MTPQARIWTDGSCVSAKRGERGSGGWAAVIHDGSEGHVRRGRVAKTTSTRMELRAAVEGLRAFERGRWVELIFDCTAILAVHDRWRRKEKQRGGDKDIATELAAEFERLHVKLTLLDSGKPLEHRRAHLIAQAEARAEHAGRTEELPIPEIRENQVTGRRVLRALTHARGCAPGRCVVNCAFFRREQQRLKERAEAQYQSRTGEPWRRDPWRHTDYQNG